MRYQLNLLSFSDEDAQALGISPALTRLCALFFATLLVTASIIHCGNIGMIALIVPAMCRYLFSADYKSLFSHTILLGSLLLLISKLITDHLSQLLGYLPVGMVVSLLGTPLFALILMKQRRDFE